MAVITAAILQALNTGVKKNFQDGYKQMSAASFWQQVATLVPSTTASNTYGWLGDFPKMREWVGDRVVKDIKESGYAITNKLYEATLTRPRPKPAAPPRPPFPAPTGRQ